MDRVKSYRYLGVNLDENLTFNTHINSLSCNLSRIVGILFKINNFIPFHSLISLYYSLIYSQLSYGIEVWCGASRGNLDRLAVIQRKAVRAISGLDYFAHTDAYFESNSLLKIDSVYRFKIIVYMFRMINMDYDSALFNRVIEINHTHDHNTRNRMQLTAPLYQRAKAQKSFLFSAINLWNVLPDSLILVPTLNQFKTGTKIVPH